MCLQMQKSLKSSAAIPKTEAVRLHNMIYVNQKNQLNAASVLTGSKLLQLLQKQGKMYSLIKGMHVNLPTGQKGDYSLLKGESHT